MNKVIIAAVAAVVLLAAGWYFMSSRSTAPQPEPSTTSDTLLAPPAEKNTSVLGSMKGVMGLGKKMACTYTEAGVSSTVFVEGNKMKFASTVNGSTMYGLFDGSTQYTWSEGGEKQGFKMDAACLAEMKQWAENTPAGSAASTRDYETLGALENVQCVPAESEDFSVPAGITFADQCAMLRDSMKALEQMQR